MVICKWLFIYCSLIKLEFKVLVFVEGGEPENPEKNSRSKDENQQQTQQTYDARSRNWNGATFWRETSTLATASPHPLLRVAMMMYSCDKYNKDYDNNDNDNNDITSSWSEINLPRFLTSYQFVSLSCWSRNRTWPATSPVTMYLLYTKQ